MNMINDRLIAKEVEHYAAQPNMMNDMQPQIT
jgi:hypothetical protein